MSCFPAFAAHERGVWCLFLQSHQKIVKIHNMIHQFTEHLAHIHTCSSMYIQTPKFNTSQQLHVYIAYFVQQPIPSGRGDMLCDKVLHNLHSSMKAGIEQQPRTLEVPEVLPSPPLHRLALLLEQFLLCCCLFFPLLPTLLECIQYASVQTNNTTQNHKCMYAG